MEGASKRFTKPKGNNKRVKPCARVNAAAATINDQVKVRGCLPRGRRGAAASDSCRGAACPAARGCRGA